MSKMQQLLSDKPRLINIGLRSFADGARQRGAEVFPLDWRPPGRGDAYLARLVALLADDDAGPGAAVAAANRIALQRLSESQPVWVDVQPARQALADMDDHTILHAGPLVAWEDMCGPMRGGIIGALIYEGLAGDPKEAKALAGSGQVQLAPCHSRYAVGPMAGIISPSMPVVVVRNEAYGNVAFATLNEGWGRTLRFGAYDEAVMARLKWMEQTLAPALKKAIKHLGGINVKSITARALQMGDECHNRDLAATALLFKELAPALAAVNLRGGVLREVLHFLSQQEHFFLNISMAACKASLHAAAGLSNSTLVTVVARNGVEVGIQVSCSGERWYTAPATIPLGLFFPGYSEGDANPDLGDSAISETAGIGAFAMGAAPAIVQFVGGTPEDALRFTLEMYEITLGENPHYALPPLSFRGTPTGIDIRRVVETGIAPVVNTGIAHKESGHGLVGAGIVPVPLECFEKALRGVAEAMNVH
ncbi:MAG: DUF1116 domain-containing protein [Chloroflexi bacterium]|nr:DUF1116 domain-containing protein [Chloroflexota bacterium]